MLNTQLVRDRFGQYYKIQTLRDKAAAKSLKPELFRSNIQAKRFVDNLITPTGYWKNIYYTASVTRKPLLNDILLKNGIAELLKAGKIRVYKIDIPSYADHPPEKRTVSDNKNNKHTFAPATTLLITNPKEVLTFSDKKEATKYLSEISPDKESLKNLAAELDLPKTQSVNDSGVILDQLATKLASGEIVVVVDRYSAPPAAASENKEKMHSDKSAGYGPVMTATVMTKTDECKCTIKSLTAECSHGRSQSKKGILQVVPSSGKTRMEEYELMGIKVTLKEEYAGTDIVNCNMHLQNNKSDSCYFITDETNNIVNQPSTQLTIKGTNDTSIEKWPIHAHPQKINIQGYGCDKAGKTVYVEKLPNQYYTVQADISIFKEWSNSVNKGWEKWGKTFFNISPIELAPKITGPAGTFAANWGWKENNDWRAYYNISCDFGLRPILGIEIKIIISMGTLALTAAGIPPNISKLAAEHIADLRLSAGANCKASLIGKPKGKFYTDGSQEITGEAKFSTEGGVDLEILFRAGSDYIISAELSVSGESKVTGEDLVSLNKSGVFLQSTISLTPFIGTAKVKIRYLKIRTKTKEKKWEPWKAVELYKSESKKLLPR